MVTGIACTAQYPAPQGRAAEVESTPTPAPAVAVTSAAPAGRWVDLDVADDLVSARGCAVERGGALWCWGGRAGDVTRSGGAAPARVVGVEHARAVAVSENQVCRVDADGRVRCFDGMGPFWREVAGIERAIDVAVASDRGCALAEGGALACWQDGGPASPVADGVADFALGGHGGCVLFAAGGLACWSHAVQRAAQRGGVRRLDAVGVRDLAIADDRWLWIVDAEGKVRRGDPFPEGPDWVEYGAVAGAVEIAAAFDHVCVRTGEGAALCRGNNTAGQLGDGTSERREAFVVTATGGVEALALGEGRTCLRGAEDIRCAGLDRSLDAEDEAGALQHTIVGLRARALAASRGTTCALDDAGAVLCWGLEGLLDREIDERRLGIVAVAAPTVVREGAGGLRGIWEQERKIDWVDGAGRIHHSRWVESELDAQPYLDTVSVADDATPVRALGGGFVSCTIAERGAALACGVAPELRASVPGIRGALAFASAERSVCAIDLRGRVVCALLPDLYEEDSTVVPATVPGVAGAVGIAASGREFCAVAGDGRVRCWGVQAGPRELDGGHLRLEVRLGPVAATDLRGVAAICGNDLGFGSVDREGRVRRWRLDDGAAIDEATPTFDAAVVEVVAGDEHFCARDVAGAVTCWGVERQGQFGRVPRAVSLVPTPLRFGGPAG